MNRKALLLAAAASLLAAAGQAANAATITFGSTSLADIDGNQAVQVFVAGGEAVTAASLNAQLSGSGTLPKITAVDLVTGTVFAGFSPTQSPVQLQSNGTIGSRSVDVDPFADPLPTLTGVLATLQIDTTGLNPGDTFNLRLTNVGAGNNSTVFTAGGTFEEFAVSGAPNATFTVVPEPGTIGLAGVTAAVGLLARRRRVA